MAKVEEEMRACINLTSFGGKPLLCYRGIAQQDYVFSDEENLKSFLSLSEDLKLIFRNPSYVPTTNTLWNDLVSIWNINENFTSDYISDYAILNNEAGELTTAWKDKYTTSVYSTSPTSICRRFELQPLPYFVRWYHTNELHYLPYKQRRDITDGLWNSMPGLLLPSTVLKLCFKVIPDPPNDVLKLIALLAWVTEADARTYYQNLHTDMTETLNNDMARERWKQHALYKNSKQQLEQN